MVGLNPASATGVEASPLVVRIGRTVRGRCIGASSTGLVRLLLVLLLVFLDFLGLTLALFIELLVLGLDFGIAVFRLAATTAGTGWELVCGLRFDRLDLLPWKRGTHVSSMFIRRGGYFLSSNMEWWYSLRQVFMRS